MIRKLLLNLRGKDAVILATLCWFWTGVGLLAADGEARELLANPGFEGAKLPSRSFRSPGDICGLELLNGWFGAWGSGGDADAVKDKKIAHSGEQCLCLQYKPDGRGYLKQVVITARGVKIKPGEKYLVRLWVKGGDIGKEFGVTFYEYAEKKPNREYLGYTSVKASLPLKLSAQWQLFRGIYDPKSKDADTATLYFGSASTNAFWMDDASMRVLDPRPLPERINATDMEKNKERYVRLFQSSPERKAKFSRWFERLYDELDNLKEAAEAGGVSLPEQYEQEWELDRLQDEYQKFRYEIAFDGIKM